MSARFTTGYMDNAVFDLQTVIREAVANLTPVRGEFDTLVGTGFSGGLIIPTLALRLRKKFVLIRKETDDSHHGSGRLLGELGDRWIFVDDFTATGATRDRVVEKVAAAALLHDHKTTHVACYYYHNGVPCKYQKEI